jgi:methionine-rich copper-binding protein CopC
MPALQITNIRRKIDYRKPELHLQITTNQEALVEAQIKTPSGRFLSTLNRVQIFSDDSSSSNLNRKYEKTELKGELKEKNGHPFRPGSYIVEVTATSQDQQKVTRHFPFSLVT